MYAVRVEKKKIVISTAMATAGGEGREAEERRELQAREMEELRDREAREGRKISPLVGANEGKRKIKK